MTLSKRCVAKFIGIFWLVLGGCGSAVLAAAFPDLGIGFAGVALAGAVYGAFETKPEPMVRQALSGR